MKLVCVSAIILEIGEVRRGLTRGPHHEPEPDQCFLVVDQATSEDWVNCMVSFGNDREHNEMLTHIGGPWYYYEIKTD